MAVAARITALKGKHVLEVLGLGEFARQREGSLGVFLREMNCLLLNGFKPRCYHVRRDLRPCGHCLRQGIHELTVSRTCCSTFFSANSRSSQGISKGWVSACSPPVCIGIPIALVDTTRSVAAFPAHDRRRCFRPNDLAGRSSVRQRRSLDDANRRHTRRICAILYNLSRGGVTEGCCPQAFSDWPLLGARMIRHGSAIQISNYASTFPETERYLPQIAETIRRLSYEYRSSRNSSR